LGSSGLIYGRKRERSTPQKSEEKRSRVTTPERTGETAVNIAPRSKQKTTTKIKVRYIHHMHYVIIPNPIMLY